MTRNQATRFWHSATQCFFGGIALALLTAVCFWLDLNLATAAFAYLIAIVLLSLMGSFMSSAVLSIIAAGCLNYLFAPTTFDFRIGYPLDVVAVIAFLTTALVVTGLVGRARRLAEAALASRKALEGASQEIEALRDQLRLVIDTIPAVVWSKLPDGSADFLNQRFRDYTGLSLVEGHGWGWMNAFHPEDRAMDAWRAALAAGEPFEKEARLRRADGEYRWFLLRAVPLRDERGKIAKWYGTTIDIEDRKQAEARQKLLLDELNHRVKNTLLAVQSIAMQMARHAEPPERFYAAFKGRLLALSHAHDLLTRCAWEGASLHDLVRQMLAPYAAGDERRIALAGPEVRLNPNAAVGLAMAFHELATNAAKYGASSTSNGRIAITWTAERAGAASAVEIRWAESGGPPVRPPCRRGFGSRLIERGLAHELEAELWLEFAPAGVECRIRLPLTHKVRLA